MNIARTSNAVIALQSGIIKAGLVFATLITLLCVSTPAASAQTFSLLFQFRSGPGGINPYAGVVLDASGNLYGTTYNDGAFASGTVFKINAAGQENVLHSFSQFGGDGAFPWYGTLVRDSSGNSTAPPG